MNGILKIIVVFAVWVAFAAVAADVPNDMKKEVDHLFTYMKESNCPLERNGTKHTATEAMDHIKKKYDYFRDKIKSAEDFIEYSATKSTTSDKPYLVYREGQKVIPSKEWLLKELTGCRARNVRP